jgi:phosphopentomutase
MAAGKSKLSVLAGDGGLDLSSWPRRGETATDSAVAEVATGWIEARRPHLLFVHLPELDGVGHETGWGSPAQVQAAARADRALERVLAALDGAGLADSTLVLVTADHGGAGASHGGRDARSRLIPWVAAGPGVAGGYDLTRDAALQVRTEDTFATACAWLGIAPEKPADGRAVIRVIADSSPSP